MTAKITDTVHEMTVTCLSRPVSIRMDIDMGFVTDAVLVMTMQQHKVPEEELVQVMARVLQEGDLMVDAGANAGLFTTLASQYVGVTGQVIAVEPGANNIPKIKRNIELSSIQNIRLVEQPLWNDEVDVDFFLYEDSGHNSITPDLQTDIGAKMRATTLDVLCRGKVPKLIKIDIEGAEVDALRGGHQLLQKHPPFVVCEMNREALLGRGESPASMRDLMKLYGYEAFMIDMHGNLPALVPHSSRLMPMRMNSNILFSTMEAVGKAWDEVKW